MENNKVQQTGRLVFINPNAVNENVNGVPLTPPYEDMCIAVDLEVEVVHRIKNGNVGGNGGDFNSSTFFMSWSSQYQTDNDGNFTGKLADRNYVSFLQGEDAINYKEGMSKPTYLTSYYTDISLEDIRRRNIVEGLGISNVDIAYDNMYMPTITIKFIDVRGSSLFGREEEVHSGNEITAETMFGCFFTLPYPKFKLHVKGFYGDAVTYQLACNGFKGRFNSQTGNFEITATFLGYQYSLLTDVPFAYLMAAPYCEYVGKKYWEKQIETPDWQLSEGKKMMKLYEIYVNLKKNLRTNINNNPTNDQINVSNKSVAVQQLWNMWLNIKKGLIKHAGTGGFFGYKESDKGFLSSNNNYTYYLFLTESEGKTIDAETLHKYQTINTEIGRFNNAFPNDVLDFQLAETFENENVNTVKLVDYNKNDDGDVVVSLTPAHYPENAQELKQWLEEKVKECKENNDDFFKKKQYGAVFYDGGFEKSIGELTSKINVEQSNVQKKSVDYVPEEIANSISFKPSIGNFFKIIIAHLETFTEMMYQCSSVIVNQMKEQKGREPSTLNIHIDDTDVAAATKFIPPFPAVFKKQVTDSDGDSSPFKALGWVGDFSANFEEEKLITNLYDAIQRVSDKEEALTQKTVELTNLFPSMPFDLYIPDTLNMPNGLTTDMASALLANRMTQIFGVLNNGKLTDTTIAETHGKMDALNLFQSVANKEQIRKIFFKKTEENNYESLKDIMKDIIVCKDNNAAMAYSSIDKSSNNSTYAFEHHPYGQPPADSGNSTPKYMPMNKTRTVHPVLVPMKDNTYAYTYIWGDTPKEKNDAIYGFGIVPVIMKRPKLIFGKEVQNTDTTLNNFYYIKVHKPVVGEYGSNNYKTTTNLLHKESSKIFLQGYDDDTSIRKNYINDAVFNIITDKQTVKNVIDRCEKIKEGQINVGGYSATDENFAKIIDRYFDFDMSKYFNENETQYLAKERKDDIQLKPSSIDYNKINTTDKQFELACGCNRQDINSKLEFIDTNTAFNSNDLSNYFVPYSLCECVTRSYKDSVSGYETKNRQTVSLDITTSFLNEFNNVIGEHSITKNGEEIKFKSDNEELIAFKCWMLLHSIPLKWKEISNILHTSKTNGYVKRVPLAMVLLLGGAAYFMKKTSRYCYGEEKSLDNCSNLYYQISTQYGFMNFTYNSLNSLMGYNGSSNPYWVHRLIGYHNVLEGNNVGFNSFFVKDDNGDYKFLLQYTNRNINYYYPITESMVLFNELFGFEKDTKFNKTYDYCIMNKLEEVFIKWVRTNGKSIVEKMINSNKKSSWRFFKGMIQECKDSLNGNGKSQAYDFFHKRTRAYYGKVPEEANQTPVNIATNWYSTESCVTRYCDHFNVNWTKNNPLYKWCGVWGGVYHKSAGSAPEKVIGLISGRFYIVDDKQGYWFDENDEHWTAIFDDNEFITYWKSNTSFMKELVELYTSDCLVCLNAREIIDIKQDFSYLCY